MREGEKKTRKGEEETVFRKENQGTVLSLITNQEKGVGDNGERTCRVLLGHRFNLVRKHFSGAEH